jgi:4-hydroxybenzoate polyprenyltransferase
MKKSFDTIERMPTSYPLWAASFLSLIVARMLVETFAGGIGRSSGGSALHEFSHVFLFFLFSYLLFLILLPKFTGIPVPMASNVLLVGFSLILTPPLIDLVLSGGQGFWSFYKFDGLEGLSRRFLTFFGDRPDIGITYGVRFEVLVAVLILGTYVYFKSKKAVFSLLSALFFYAVFFILGTFPSWIAILVEGARIGFLEVREVHVAQMFFSPIGILSHDSLNTASALNLKMSLIYAPLTFLAASWLLFRHFPPIFLALLGNARWPQTIYHGGLLLAGMGLATVFTEVSARLDFFNILAVLVVLMAVEFAWLASVVANDIFDQNIDILTNRHRPLPKKIVPKRTYVAIGLTFFALSLLLAAIVSPTAAALLIGYQSAAWIYSAPPLRLKRVPFVATFLAALAGMLVLVSGYLLLAPDGTLKNLPASLVTLLLFAYTCSLPLKDFKDIEGDRAEGVRTIPVLFGESKGKSFVGSGIFLSYVLSVFVLHEPSLFWPAVVSGGFSFWILAASHAGENGWLRYRFLPGWILGCVTAYGLAAAWMMFR